MIELIVFVVLALFILVVYEIREYGKQRVEAAQNESASAAEQTNADGDECCGQHLVCERESLLQSNAQIEYYDDEELDVLADIQPAAYTEEQHTALREVFDTLRERDVAGWVRSLQLRNIALPDDIREEALMIVRERRERNNNRIEKE